MKYNVHDIIRLETNAGSYRFFRVQAVLIGAINAEDHYELRSLDRDRSNVSKIPMAMLDSHGGALKV